MPRRLHVQLAMSEILKDGKLMQIGTESAEDEMS